MKRRKRSRRRRRKNRSNNSYRSRCSRKKKYVEELSTAQYDTISRERRQQTARCSTC